MRFEYINAESAFALPGCYVLVTDGTCKFTRTPEACREFRCKRDKYRERPTAMKMRSTPEAGAAL